MREDFIEIACRQKQIQQRGEHKAGRLKGVIRIQHFAAHHSGLGVLVGKGNGFLNRAVQNNRIGIEQQDIAAFGDPHALIIGRGKTSVFRVFDEDNLRKFGLDHLYRSIGGRIVNDDDFKVHAVCLLEH